MVDGIPQYVDVSQLYGGRDFQVMINGRFNHDITFRGDIWVILPTIQAGLPQMRLLYLWITLTERLFLRKRYRKRPRIRKPGLCALLITNGEYG